jgi:uncharacterized protein (TIGR03435 family)
MIVGRIPAAAIAILAVSGLIIPPPGFAQSAAPETAPKFEVASVKSNNSGEDRVTGGFQPGGRYHVTNYTLLALIAAAYARPPVNRNFLTEGGPKWIDTDRFDIDAKAAGEFPTTLDSPSEPRRLALQALLGDRFGLRLHHETKRGPIYALVFARSDKDYGSAASSIIRRMRRAR